jgi:hypothetical protein
MPTDTLFGPDIYSFHFLAMFEEPAQAVSEIVYVFISKVKTSVSDSFKVCRNVTDETAITVTHCFENAQRQAFRFGRMRIHVAVAEKFFEKASFDKTGKQYARVSLGKFEDFLAVFCSSLSIAGNYEFRYQVVETPKSDSGRPFRVPCDRRKRYTCSVQDPVDIFLGLRLLV